MPEPLPIDALRPDLEAAWSRHANFILRAPTGSGKSTRVPRFLHEWSGFPEGRRILILQPRRMAARLLARRVAAEFGEPPGQTAGYRIRFEAAESEATRLLFVTEGLLLRLLMRPEGLKGTGAILFDEFHERHLEGDVGLGLAVERQLEGWPGRIGIFSATLETAGLRDYLPDAAILESEGRQHPVAIHHAGGRVGEAPWDLALEGIKRALASGAEADILVFMPGRHEINRTVELLRGERVLRGWDVYPLHGELDTAAQDRAVEPGKAPRIIVSTNIAETSLTLPGIRTVIDSGLARVPDYDPRRGVNTLMTEKISRSSAEQRAGRAGRVAPGNCYRLWSGKDHEHRAAHTVPEIRRLDLAEIRLQLAVLGKLEGFRWLERPPEAAWARAGELLEDLGATREGCLTPTGREMARFPLHPRFSRILLAAREFGAGEWIMAAVALLQGRSILLPLNDKRKAATREDWWEAARGVSDLMRGILVWRRWLEAGRRMEWCREWGIHGQALRQATRVYGQLQGLMDTGKEPAAFMEAPTVEGFAKSLLTGYVDQLGKRLDRGTRRCELVHGRRGELSRDSLVREAEIFVAADIEEREFRGEAVLFLGAATAVKEAWLEEVYPGEVTTRGHNRLDPERRRIERVRERVFRGLVLERSDGGMPDPAEAGALLARHIVEAGWPLKNWNAEAESWIRRVNVLAETCPELEIQPITEADRVLFIEQICDGAVSYKEVKDRPVLPVLRTWLPESLLPLLDDWVPVRFELRDGRQAKLRYEPDGTVVLPARIQQLYGIPGSSLAICRGRKRLRLEILAPNGRPVQVTDDLDGFWTGQYPQIKKDLFGRYPKHEWR